MVITDHGDSYGMLAMMMITMTTMIMLPSQFRRTWECLRPQREEHRGECRRGNGVVAVAAGDVVCGDLYQIFVN